MKTWEIKHAGETVASIAAHIMEAGGLHGKNPFVWTLKDESGKVIGTLYLGTNMTMAESHAEGKSSPD